MERGSLGDTAALFDEDIGDIVESMSCKSSWESAAKLNELLTKQWFH